METGLVRMTWFVINEGLVSFGKPFSIGDCISGVIHEIEDRMTISIQERQQIQQYLSQREQLIQTLVYR